MVKINYLPTNTTEKNTRNARTTLFFFIVWKQNHKQNNNKRKKNSIKTERQNIHHEKNNKTDRKKETANNQSNSGFKKGLLVILFQRNRQTLTKEKAKKKDRRKSKVFSKGANGQKTKTKDGILKGKTKGKTRKQNTIGKKKDLKDKPLGELKIKKPRKLQENSLFGPSYKNKRTKTQRKINKTTKKQIKNFLHVGKQPPIFGKFLFFFNLHSFISAKLCFAENTIKIVFSAEHSFCISQIVRSTFEAPSQNGTLATKVPFWA